MNDSIALRFTLTSLFLVACGGGADLPDPMSGLDDPTSPAMMRDGGVAPTDAGTTPDAGMQPMTEECARGYAGPRCDQCAPGWQDGNADGICSLACDATGEDAPSCGQGTCFIDTEIDGRACRCDVGHVGASCDTCDVGYADLDGDGVCIRECQLECGDYGSCQIEADDSELCVCDEGYEGAACEMCVPGYVAYRGHCILDTPDVDGMALWLDADASGTLTVRNDRVVRWTDRRGGAEAPEASVALSTLRPELVDAAMNGRSVVRFDGVDDRLNVQSFAGFAGDDYTVFALVYPRSIGSAGIFEASHSEFGVAAALDLVHPGQGGRFIHRVPLTPSVQDSVLAQGFAPTQPTLIGVRRWTSGLLDHYRMWGEDGGDVMGLQVDDTLVEAGNLGSLRLTLGTGLTDETLDGDIAEIIVYERALEEPEAERVLLYLAAKWGVR